jgi:hypothetical protein
MEKTRKLLDLIRELVFDFMEVKAPYIIIGSLLIAYLALKITDHLFLSLTAFIFSFEILRWKYGL